MNYVLYLKKILYFVIHDTVKNHKIKSDLMLSISNKLMHYHFESTFFNHHTDTKIVKIICDYIESKL